MVASGNCHLGWIVSRLAQAIAIELHKRCELGDRSEHRGQHEVVAMRRGELVGFRCWSCPDPDRRSRPLHWSRKDREVRDAAIAAFVGKSVLRPGFVDEFDALGKKLTTFVHRPAEAIVTTFLKAPADAEVKSAIAQDIDHGIVLGQAYWVMEREQGDCRPKAQPARPLSDCSSEHLR